MKSASRESRVDAVIVAPFSIGRASTVSGPASNPRPQTTAVLSVTSPTVTRSGEAPSECRARKRRMHVNRNGHRRAITNR